MTESALKLFPHSRYSVKSSKGSERTYRTRFHSWLGNSRQKARKTERQAKGKMDLGVKEPNHRKEHSTSSVRLSSEQESVYAREEIEWVELGTSHIQLDVLRIRILFGCIFMSQRCHFRHKRNSHGHGVNAPTGRKGIDLAIEYWAQLRAIQKKKKKGSYFLTSPWEVEKQKLWFHSSEWLFYFDDVR